MDTKEKRQWLQSEAVARAWFGEPRPGRPGDGAELFWTYPNHSDQDPSLKVNPKKNAWMCGPCGAWGNAWELAAFLLGKGWEWESLSVTDQRAVADWLREHGLLPEKGKPSPKAREGERGVILREHVYASEDGNPLVKKIRWGSEDPEKDKTLKHFSWQRWEGGKWVNHLDAYKQAALPLYRIDKIKDLTQGTPVIVCEGEHDADAGASIGLNTTTSGGTGTFPQRHVEWFRGRPVIVVSHADGPGAPGSGKACCAAPRNGG